MNSLITLVRWGGITWYVFDAILEFIDTYISVQKVRQHNWHQKGTDKKIAVNENRWGAEIFT